MNKRFYLTQKLNESVSVCGSSSTVRPVQPFTRLCPGARCLRIWTGWTLSNSSRWMLHNCWPHKHTHSNTHWFHFLFCVRTETLWLWNSVTWIFNCHMKPTNKSLHLCVAIDWCSDRSGWLARVSLFGTPEPQPSSESWHCEDMLTCWIPSVWSGCCVTVVLTVSDVLMTTPSEINLQSTVLFLNFTEVWLTVIKRRSDQSNLFY